MSERVTAAKAGNVSAGRLIAAPEGFVSEQMIRDITLHGIDDARRNFLRSSFAAAVLGSAGLSSRANAADATYGESVISTPTRADGEPTGPIR